MRRYYEEAAFEHCVLEILYSQDDADGLLELNPLTGNSVIALR